MSLLKKLDEIRARHTKATKGPWIYEKRLIHGWGLVGLWAKDKEIFGTEGGWDSDPILPSEDDGDFIAHARLDLPELEEALREAHALIIDAKRLAWIKKEDFCYDKMDEWLEKYDEHDSTA